jgi:hypothetical protein
MEDRRGLRPMAARPYDLINGIVSRRLPQTLHQPASFAVARRPRSSISSNIRHTTAPVSNHILQNGVSCGLPPEFLRAPHAPGGGGIISIRLLPEFSHTRVLTSIMIHLTCPHA